MGFLESILSNPQLIGMAMAGLSRDPEAPMNAMKSLGMVEDINQKRAELARQEQARQANAGLLQALMKSQAEEGNIMGQAMRDYGNIRTMPSTTQQFIPNQQTGTAMDYDTGQAYQPAQVPNRNRSTLIQDFFNN
jgi:hypothetical protein